VSEQFDIIAKTQYGLEDVLAAEIETIGGQDIQTTTRAVKYRGDNAVLYKSNYLLRTALRVLKPIDTFRIFNDHQLLRKAKRIPWESYFGVDDTFAIDAVTFSDIFRNSKYIALKTKDAVADRFREVYGRRPNVDIKEPHVRINVHIADKECTISLDSSGHSLDKRGYKLEQTAASINEVLASGLIALSGRHGTTPFIDPMCGSGTIAIEAALKAANIAPGTGTRFGFENWPDFDRPLWQQVKLEAKSAIRTPPSTILATDMSPGALEVATSNARRAGVLDHIVLARQDFLDSAGNNEDETIIINPPYGERLSPDEDMSEFYGEMGTRLKHFYPGAKAWILSSNLAALKMVGLRPTRKIKLYNGKLECRLCGYELYAGSREGDSQPP